MAAGIRGDLDTDLLICVLVSGLPSCEILWDCTMFEMSTLNLFLILLSINLIMYFISEFMFYKRSILKSLTGLSLPSSESLLFFVSYF
jgi:hypothetical protein